ncbi:MAG: periplasmic protein [Prolixibacteraceae bacterium]|nr:MAG: periplasmic protein [Prolixibacteraceae bacterium]
MKTIKMMLLVLVFLVTGFCQVKAQESKIKDGVYTEVEEMPEYQGGINALMSEIASGINYPDEAKKNGIQGKVFVSFVIDEKGKVTNAKIERGVEPSLDKESLRVVNELKTWIPGKEKGKVVKVAYTIPINYALNGKPDKKG